MAQFNDELDDVNPQKSGAATAALVAKLQISLMNPHQQKDALFSVIPGPFVVLTDPWRAILPVLLYAKDAAQPSYTYLALDRLGCNELLAVCRDGEAPCDLDFIVTPGYDGYSISRAGVCRWRSNPELRANVEAIATQQLAVLVDAVSQTDLEWEVSSDLKAAGRIVEWVSPTEAWESYGLRSYFEPSESQKQQRLALVRELVRWWVDHVITWFCESDPATLSLHSELGERLSVLATQASQWKETIATLPSSYLVTRFVYKRANSSDMQACADVICPDGVIRRIHETGEAEVVANYDVAVHYGTHYHRDRVSLEAHWTVCNPAGNTKKRTYTFGGFNDIDL